MDSEGSDDDNVTLSMDERIQRKISTSNVYALGRSSVEGANESQKKFGSTRSFNDQIERKLKEDSAGISNEFVDDRGRRIEHINSQNSFGSTRSFNDQIERKLKEDSAVISSKVVDFNARRLGQINSQKIFGSTRSFSDQIERKLKENSAGISGEVINFKAPKVGENKKIWKDVNELNCAKMPPSLENKIQNKILNNRLKDDRSFQDRSQRKITNMNNSSIEARSNVYLTKPHLARSPRDRIQRKIDEDLSSSVASSGPANQLKSSRTMSEIRNVIVDEGKYACYKTNAIEQDLGSLLSEKDEAVETNGKMPHNRVTDSMGDRIQGKISNEKKRSTRSVLSNANERVKPAFNQSDRKDSMSDRIQRKLVADKSFNKDPSSNTITSTTRIGNQTQTVSYEERIQTKIEIYSDNLSKSGLDAESVASSGTKNNKNEQQSNTPDIKVPHKEESKYDAQQIADSDSVQSYKDKIQIKIFGAGGANGLGSNSDGSDDAESIVDPTRKTVDKSKSSEGFSNRQFNNVSSKETRFFSSFHDENVSASTNKEKSTKIKDSATNLLNEKHEGKKDKKDAKDPVDTHTSLERDQILAVNAILDQEKEIQNLDGSTKSKSTELHHPSEVDAHLITAVTEVYHNPDEEDDIIFNAVVIDEILELEEIERSEERAKKKIIVAAIFVVIAAIAITIPVGLLVFRNQEEVITVSPSLVPTFFPRAPSQYPSIRPSSMRYEQLIYLLSEVSDVETFYNYDAPQYKALQWLAYEDTTPLHASNLVQRYVLAVFYYATHGDNWAFCEKDGTCLCLENAIMGPPLPCFLLEPDRHVAQLGQDSECNWFNYDCVDGKIVKMVLGGSSHGIGLAGTIPFELKYLNKLQKLQIPANDIKGSIPDIFHNMTDLAILQLSKNKLTGTLPRSMLECKSLRVLDLSLNQLTGTIPKDFGKLNQLRTIYLYGNKFTGKIPSGIGDITRLEYFVVRDNQLSGSFPESLFALTSLKTMDVTYNHLNGTLPNEFNLPYVKNISVAHNTIGGEVPDALFNLERLQILDLSENMLSGTIPSTLAEIQLSYLALYGNNFSGEVPDFLCSMINSMTQLKCYGGVDCEPGCCDCILRRQSLF